MAHFVPIAGLAIKGFFGMKAMKSKKQLMRAQLELGQQRMELANDMAKWIKDMDARNWEAMRPARELGYKAIGAMDAHMRSGDFNPRRISLPAQTSTRLPRWNAGGVAPPVTARPQTGIPNRWPEQVPVPGGAPLPDTRG